MEEHPMQREFPLMARMQGPSVVPINVLRTARTYRQAVRLCLQLSRLRNVTYREIARECGLVYQHVGDYFNADDLPHRRDLPGDSVASLEAFLGNTAISQWHAMGSCLTVLEEMQASRMAA